MATIIYDTYQTDGSANAISLNGVVGFAQLGATSITIDGVPKVVATADANGIYKNNFDIILDTNSALSGKLLEVTSKITILNTPAGSSLILTLSGGGADKEYDLNNPATGVAKGDVIEYYASIAFLQPQ
jgi:hypothetical protein